MGKKPVASFSSPSPKAVVEAGLEFDFDFLDEFESLSHWEFIDASDADFEGFPSDNGNGDGNVHIDEGLAESLQTVVVPIISDPVAVQGDGNDGYHGDLYEVYNSGEDYDVNNDDADEDEDEEEEENEKDQYDLDDELVPFSVRNKFERQRMRKLGKRAFSKMLNSKRSPYLFVRPGCLHGKHGLGLKHSY